LRAVLARRAFFARGFANEATFLVFARLVVLAFVADELIVARVCVAGRFVAGSRTEFPLASAFTVDAVFAFKRVAGRHIFANARSAAFTNEVLFFANVGVALWFVVIAVFAHVVVDSAVARSNTILVISTHCTSAFSAFTFFGW